jgi:UDP-N-acetylmuramoyl-L-alanyl-D-glutamate--2,6-diaminopimelate ligase
MFSELIIKSPELTGLKPKNDFKVNSLCYDSRKIKAGDVFFALKGLRHDGNVYVPEVISKGASAVFTDSSRIFPYPCVHKVNDCRSTLASLSNIFYDFPSHKMKVTGVTGTNGKTTVTSLINFVLRYAGYKTGLIGTNGNYINDEFFHTEFTTPESVELNRLLNEMYSRGVEYVTMEVSSHSLIMKRINGIEFDVAVFTNLTPEHLDFHETVDNYFKAKKILFDSLKRINLKNFNTVSVYNSDDPYGKKAVENTEAERISFGFGSSAYSVKELKMDFKGMSFDMLVPLNGEGKDKISFKSKLTGKFNVYNIMAAVAALKTYKLTFKTIRDAVAEFKPVEGRFMQFVLKNGSIAIVDYSHTPDSLLNVLSTIREIRSVNSLQGKVITVFGCGGNRDRTKRPKMAAIAEELSDTVIVTSDNPRNEKPMDIISEIETGFKSKKYLVIENREEAICKAIKLSDRNDVILIAGKGHEDYQIIGDKKYHFSDKEIVLRYC